MSNDAASRRAVLAACVGQARTAPSSTTGRSAIDKRPIDGPVLADVDGFAGDEQADHKHHGGPDQALYAYAQEDADHWEAVLGRAVPPGAFGENLRLTGLDTSAARIGDVWRVGAATVQVTGARTPCRTFAAFWDVPDLVRRFLDAGRPGAYLRVLTPGPVQAGDLVEVVETAATDLTVAEVARILTREPHRAARLLEAPALAGRAHAWARARIGEPV